MSPLHCHLVRENICQAMYVLYRKDVHHKYRKEQS